LDQFLDKMHVLTLVYADRSKKFSFSPFKMNKDKENIKNEAVIPRKASPSSDASKKLSAFTAGRKNTLETIVLV